MAVNARPNLDSLGINLNYDCEVSPYIEPDIKDRVATYLGEALGKFNYLSKEDIVSCFKRCLKNYSISSRAGRWESDVLWAYQLIGEELNELNESERRRQTTC